MGPRSEELVFNSVLNLRRVTHFWPCLETQVRGDSIDIRQFVSIDWVKIAAQRW